MTWALTLLYALSQDGDFASTAVQVFRAWCLQAVWGDDLGYLEIGPAGPVFWPGKDGVMPGQLMSLCVRVTCSSPLFSTHVPLAPAQTVAALAPFLWNISVYGAIRLQLPCSCHRLSRTRPAWTDEVVCRATW